jgi:hypothetical protein
VSLSYVYKPSAWSSYVVTSDCSADITGTLSAGIIVAIVFGILFLVVLPIGVAIACCMGVACCVNMGRPRASGQVVVAQGYANGGAPVMGVPVGVPMAAYSPQQQALYMQQVQAQQQAQAQAQAQAQYMQQQQWQQQQLRQQMVVPSPGPGVYAAPAAGNIYSSPPQPYSKSVV